MNCYTSAIKPYKTHLAEVKKINTAFLQVVKFPGKFLLYMYSAFLMKMKKWNFRFLMEGMVKSYDLFIWSINNSIWGYDESILGYDLVIWGYDKSILDYDLVIWGYDESILDYDLVIWGYDESILDYDLNIWGYDDDILDLEKFWEGSEEKMDMKLKSEVINKCLTNKAT